MNLYVVYVVMFGVVMKMYLYLLLFLFFVIVVVEFVVLFIVILAFVRFDVFRVFAFVWGVVVFVGWGLFVFVYFLNFWVVVCVKGVLFIVYFGV